MTKFKKIILYILIFCLVFLSSSSLPSYAITDYKIMNKPTSTKQQIKEWAKGKDTSELFLSLIDLGYDIAVKYEIDPTVMLAQTAIETNYCKFNGVIGSSYHNTCGMKTAIGGGNYQRKAHQKFETWEEGFIAQAQHLRLYSGYCHHYKEDCPHECPKIVDPRHFKEINGRAKYVSDLSSAWATDDSYGKKINSLCNEIVNTRVDKNETETKNKASEQHKKKVVISDEKNKKIEEIKKRISKGNNNKINYIKELLHNKKSKNSFKDKIKNKLK